MITMKLCTLVRLDYFGGLFKNCKSREEYLERSFLERQRLQLRTLAFIQFFLPSYRKILKTILICLSIFEHDYNEIMYEGGFLSEIAPLISLTLLMLEMKPDRL